MAAPPPKPAPAAPDAPAPAGPTAGPAPAAPAAPADPAPEEIVLSFDPATRTFAFAIVLVRRPALDGLLADPGAAAPGGAPAVEVLDAETADLAPGVPDRAIAPPARVAAVVAYCRRRVDPAAAEARAARPGAAFRVVVEAQMGPNASSRWVAAALLTHYADMSPAGGAAPGGGVPRGGVPGFMPEYVAAGLKNRLALADYGDAAAARASAYGANKAHALAVFAAVRARFPVAPHVVASSHVADAVAQALAAPPPGREPPRRAAKAAPRKTKKAAPAAPAAPADPPAEPAAPAAPADPPAAPADVPLRLAELDAPKRKKRA